MQGIQQVEKGNLDVQLVVDRQDEFGRIGENFNHMTGKVKSLIAEMTEISEKKKQAEIKALESQINPHFLYNKKQFSLLAQRRKLWNWILL